MDVFVYFNTSPYHSLGYEHGHPLQLVFSYSAPSNSTLFRMADEAFHAFNAPLEFVLSSYGPIAEAYRAAGLRSLSVGDVLQVGHSWLACAATSWIATTTSAVPRLAGTWKASRNQYTEAMRSVQPTACQDVTPRR